MPRTSLWQRWKALARRAAVVQSNVLLWLMYYVFVTPLGAIRLLFAGRARLDQPAWRERPVPPEDRATLARRQF